MINARSFDNLTDYYTARVLLFRAIRLERLFSLGANGRDREISERSVSIGTSHGPTTFSFGRLVSARPRITSTVIARVYFSRFVSEICEKIDRTFFSDEKRKYIT